MDSTASFIYTKNLNPNLQIKPYLLTQNLETVYWQLFGALGS